MPHYVTNKQLRPAVLESQALGTLSPALVDALSKIVRGVHRRLRPPISFDDALQETCLDVLRALPRLDPTKNPFSYITAIVWNVCQRDYRDRVNRTKLARNYWERKRKPRP